METSPVPKLSQFGETLNKAISTITQSRRRDFVITSAAGSARSLFISLLAEQSDAPLLVVADTYEIAELFRQDLAFYLPEDRLQFFPHWDTIPYDNQSPDKEVVALRFQTLTQILNQTAKVTVTTVNALMRYIMPPSVFAAHCFTIQEAESYDREDLLHRLVNMGYVRVDLVEDKGEFSVRGEIIDLFPVTESNPLRLDFFDDELESIKYFDVESQRSMDPKKAFSVLPAQEVIYDDAFHQQCLDRLTAIKADTVPQVFNFTVDQLRSKISYPGIESLLPLFYPETATLLDYFNEPPRVIYLEKDAVQEHAKQFFKEVLAECEYSKQEGNPTLDPEASFLSEKTLQDRLVEYVTLDIQKLSLSNRSSNLKMSTVDNAAIRSLASSAETIERSTTQNILEQIKKWNLAGAKITIAAGSQSKADQIRQMMENIELSVPILENSSIDDRKKFMLDPFSALETSMCILAEPVSSGFRWVDELGNTQFGLITDEEIFGLRHKQRRFKKSSVKRFFSSLGSLNPGDYVVHVEYGIGRYQGLTKISIGERESDFLVIEYQGNDKVYVPVDKFHLVQKYVGGEVGQPKLNKLGSKTWLKTKSKVRTEVDDIAEDLVRIHAERQARKGVAFSPNASEMIEFSMSFPYQETEDQERSIAEVLTDMEDIKPMDRLVCGDVGFGKTEVAMRAAYKAVLDNYQVGILVPTTILAQQHYDSFRERFKNTAVRVEMLSRFRTPKQIKIALKDLVEGRVDIIIGTHRLLSKDVAFKNLGVLVIDEEQRFGVKHKERIKQMRSTVDNLTLSATPIPRTLHMSLIGIRDISVINTPPIDRRAIRTRLMRFSDYVIQEAVNREIRRNGQIYFVHNRVESIYQVGDYLQQILPKVRIGVGHGQMGERELEQVMVDFVNHKFDILLSTTIVESGLDITNVNTIIINNADRFGLSQLYQLRGRVGRSNVQAYSYLLIPKDKILTETAQKRLSILRELNQLGSGFKIASYDLELRGAGNVLGVQQSGHIAAVGFELYTAMVGEAVEKIQKGETESKPEQEIAIHLFHEANLPDDYISNVNQRLDAYKMISGCLGEEELWNTRSSLEDRYGPLPRNAVYLFHTMQIRLLAAEISISELNQSDEFLDMVFSENFTPDQTKFLTFLHNSSNDPKMMSENRLRVRLNKSEPENIMNFLYSFKKEVGFEEKVS